MKKPVYLSDFGVVSAIGVGKDAVWKVASSGAPSGIRAGERGGATLSLALAPDLGRVTSLGMPFDNRVNALLEAALAELRPSVEAALTRYGPDRVAACVGSCDNGSELSCEALAYSKKEGRFPEAYSLECQRADLPARFTAAYFGLTGPVIAYSTACASSASTVVSARNLILSGLCDAVVVGGVDIVSDAVALGFSALEAVSDEPCVPFSATRKGISLGEAAAVFLMTRDGPSVGGVFVAGAGESADAHHMTAPDPTGAGAALAMERALADAGLEPEDIDYVNLHGTGTILNDAMESRAVAEVFRVSPPVSSTKGLTGHTLGAAGALELGLCWLALSRRDSGRLLPVHAWDGVADPDLPPLDFALAGRKAERLRLCMSNSFAFGGCNVSLILGTDTEDDGTV